MAQTPAFETALALSRFGLGSNAAGVAAVTGDIRERLKAEITAGAPVPPPDGLMTTPELVAAVVKYQMERTAARRAAGNQGQGQPGQAQQGQPQMQGDMTQMSGDGMQALNKKGLPQKPQAAVKDDDPIRPTLMAELNARFDGTIKAPQIGFNERMVMFWQNHFAIVMKKSQPTAATAGAMEREAIRPHVFGRFEDMLVAVETHPCMLDYLDNAQSIGPNSQANRAGKRGLNENLAREIMELHTLGVGSGYTQADVTAFARVITGWTFPRQQGPNQQAPVGVFQFDPRRHEPGAQVIMGKTYDQGGVDQGKAVLHDLARHPATATHIATKLARHFVADDPPPALVKRLADTFKRTDGDLAEVSRTLIASDEAWTPQLTKMRSPLEYLIALIRATGATMKPQAITVALNAMGQPWWNPGGPNGFPDTVSAWASPEGIATRMDLANALANNANPAIDPREFAQSRFGPLLSDHTAEAIARAETHAQGLSLAFLSPEFMRR
jgi:uncharacterized protein (DUF1800 family)